VSHFGETDARSRFRYSDDFGAMIVDAHADSLVFRYVDCRGKVLDGLTLVKHDRVRS